MSALSKYRVILLIASMLALQWLLGPEWLRYDRYAMLHQQQWWRLITAHWIHVNNVHLLLNMIGFALIAQLVRLREWSHSYFFGSLLLMDLFISIMLLWRQPYLAWYVGMSGVSYGLLIQGALLLWPREKIWALVLAVLCLGKIALEQSVGSGVSTEQWIGTPVLVDAHLYGVIAGISIAVLTQWHRIRAQSA